MPRIKADIPTFSRSLNIEDFLDWVSEIEKYFELMDIPEESRVKYVAYKLRGATLSWWDNLQTGRRRQRKQPIRTRHKMKKVLFAWFLPVDYEQTLYSLYQNCRQSSQTVTEYVKEFMRLASSNQLSKSDAQQVARFNNGLRYDIQAIGIGSSMYKTKTDTNQSSSSQSRGDAQVDHSKSTHEVDGGKKKKTTTTATSTDAVNKSSINPYARPIGIKCEKAHSKSEDEGLIISPDTIFKDDDDHSKAFLGLV
ncbi:RNA-directed DNA polymerase [Tanacetum coccineum]